MFFKANKVPVGLTSIARLMGMEKEEIQAWPYFEEMRDNMKDYNLRAITKEQLISCLESISIKCANDQIYHYATGIDKAISTLKTVY